METELTMMIGWLTQPLPATIDRIHFDFDRSKITVLQLGEKRVYDFVYNTEESELNK